MQLPICDEYTIPNGDDDDHLQRALANTRVFGLGWRTIRCQWPMGLKKTQYNTVAMCVQAARNLMRLNLENFECTQSELLSLCRLQPQICSLTFNSWRWLMPPWALQAISQLCPKLEEVGIDTTGSMDDGLVELARPAWPLHFPQLKLLTQLPIVEYDGDRLHEIDFEEITRIFKACPCISRIHVDFIYLQDGHVNQLIRPCADSLTDLDFDGVQFPSGSELFDAISACRELRSFRWEMFEDGGSRARDFLLHKPASWLAQLGSSFPPTLTHLDVCENVDDIGLDALLAALDKNMRLECLHVGNFMSPRPNRITVALKHADALAALKKLVLPAMSPAACIITSPLHPLEVLVRNLRKLTSLSLLVRSGHAFKLTDEEKEICRPLAQRLSNLLVARGGSRCTAWEDEP